MTDPWSLEAKEERAERKVWLTAKGQEIRYQDLTNEHLTAILKHVHRSAWITRALSLMDLLRYDAPSDWSSDGAEAALDEFLADEWEDWVRYHPAATGLSEEATRRGLAVEYDKEIMNRAELAALHVAFKKQQPRPPVRGFY